MTRPPLSREYELGLHLVRGLAAQVVLVGHGLSILKITWLGPPRFPYIHHLGVVAFFFISGMVISLTIDTRPRYGFGEYMLDRATRVLVPLVPALLVVALVDLAICDLAFYPEDCLRNLNPLAFLANMLLTANYPVFDLFGRSWDLAPIRAGSFGSMRPIWSVIVEFWIYVFFGYMALAKAGSRPIRALFALLFAYSLPFVVHNAIGGQGAGLTIVWLAGCGFYYLATRTGFPQSLDRARFAIIFALMLALILLGRWVMALNSEQYDLRYALFLCLAIVAFLELARRISFFATVPLVARVSRMIASYSYSLYLLHYTVLVVVFGLQPDENQAVLMVEGFVAANVAAVGFWWLFERRYHAVRGWVKQRLRRARPESGDAPDKGAETATTR